MKNDMYVEEDMFNRQERVSMTMLTIDDNEEEKDLLL